MNTNRVAFIFVLLALVVTIVLGVMGAIAVPLAAILVMIELAILFMVGLA